MKNYLLIAILLLSTSFYAEAQTIDLGALQYPSPEGWCSGAKFDAPFFLNGIFNADNVFTAELSDENGSFASAQIIGTEATNVSGKIKCNVPAFLLENVNYLVRIVSSSPAVTSNNTKEIDANGCPIPGGISADLTATTLTIGWNPAWCAEKYYLKWREKGASEWIVLKDILSNSYTLTGLTASTKYQFQVKNICQGVPRESSSYTVTYKATTYPQKNISPVEDGMLTVFPNPATANSSVLFHLSESEDIGMVVADLWGRNLITIADGIFDAGTHQLSVKSEHLTSGIYLVQLKTDTGIYTQKLIVQ